MSNLEENEEEVNVKEDEVKTNKSPYKKGSYISIGIALGLIYGMLFDNIALGLGIGVAIGVSIDASMAKKK